MRKPRKSRRYTSATFGSSSKETQRVLRFIPSKESSEDPDVKQVKAHRAPNGIGKAKKATQGRKRKRHVMRREMRLSICAQKEFEAAAARKAGRKAADQATDRPTQD